MVGISEIKTKKQLKLFEQIPELLLRTDPYFVPPFPGSIVKLIGPNSVFQKKHGEIHCFIATRDGKPVGRIAAIVNRAHNKYYKDTTGFFGFFDAIDDVEVAAALKTAAAERLKEKGLTSMRGPYNPSVNDEVGLLAEGFNSAPFVMTTYNPAYYLGLYESVGLSPVRNLVAFYMSAAENVSERIAKVVDRIKKKSGVTLRNVNLKKLKDELRIIHKLYNVTLDRNWGFVPIDYEDLEAAASDLKAIVDPEMILIAEKDGVPIGFSLCVPNINEFMFAARHSPPWLRVLKFIWALKTRRPKEYRLVILGVKPEYRHLGLGALFYYESLMRGKKKVIGGELSWVEENNEEIIKGITLMGGKPYKTYRIYEQSLIN